MLEAIAKMIMKLIQNYKAKITTKERTQKRLYSISKGEVFRVEFMLARELVSRVVGLE